MNSQDTASSMKIDGTTYILLAVFTAITASMSSDGASKWLEPKTLFWIQTFCGAASAGLLAFKMFRSTSFAHHQQVKDAEDNKGQPGSTEITTQISQPPPVVTSQVVTNPPKPEPTKESPIP
jgi:hypothetical protein